MTDTTSATTVFSVAVAMFDVADQDAAIAFYTEKLGYELRTDVTFGPPGQEGRWVEVAPPGSTARVALNASERGTPGGGSIGVESNDVHAEHARLSALGVEVADVMEMPGAPTMFQASDPDGNHIWITTP